MNTTEVGRTLVSLCQQGKNMEAIDTLFAADAVSEEAMDTPGGPGRVIKGRDAIRGKNQWWIDNHEVHRHSVAGPFPNGDDFAVIFKYDVTAKAGPMAGRRMAMEEVGLYSVKDGKVVRERFFYSMG
jgi:ketosteroid isomerase-like protein